MTSLFSFFARRLISGTLARVVVNFLVRRFRLSPAIANTIFVVLAEVVARQTEKRGMGKPNFPTKPPGRR